MSVQSYTAEFRAEAVKLVLAQGLTLQKAPQRISVPKGTLANCWVANARGGKSVGAPGVSRGVAPAYDCHIPCIGLASSGCLLCDTTGEFVWIAEDQHKLLDRVGVHYCAALLKFEQVAAVPTTTSRDLALLMPT